MWYQPVLSVLGGDYGQDYLTEQVHILARAVGVPVGRRSGG